MPSRMKLFEPMEPYMGRMTDTELLEYAATALGTMSDNYLSHESVDAADLELMNIVKACTPKRSAKYYVYRNLNRGTDFSAKIHGKVIFRGDIVAWNVEFKVSEKGRQRVLIERKRNVHAFAAADAIIDFNSLKAGRLRDASKIHLVEVTYNPYKASTFMCEGKPILQAKAAYFFDGKCYVHKTEVN